MFGRPYDDQVMAMAGLFQAARLVVDLAATDRFDDQALTASALSVIRLDADSVEAVYDGARGLRFGLETIDRVFTGKLGPQSRPLFQYAVAMHQLALKLDGFSHMSDGIAQGLEEIRDGIKVEAVAEDMDEEQRLYEEVAALYVKTISNLQPRIMVQGSQGRLENPLTVARVRTALFAGIRSAFLWHQLGGRRWQLLLHRKAYQNRARALLQHA